MIRSDTTVKIVSGERFTPYALARKLGAIAMLESSSFHKGRERYSLLMVREAFRLEQRGREIALFSGGKRRVVRSDAQDSAGGNAIVKWRRSSSRGRRTRPTSGRRSRRSSATN